MTKAKYSKPGRNLEVGCSGYGKMPAHMGRDENGKAKSPSVTSSIGMPLNCVCVVIFFISGNVKCLPIHQHSNHLVKTRTQSMTKVLSMLLQRVAGAIVAGVGLSHTLASVVDKRYLSSVVRLDVVQSWR